MGDIENPNHSSGVSRDPIKSRIFVGNLFINNKTKVELEDIFSKYGKIDGINMLRNFAFIQYDNEESAAEAIKQEAGRVIGNKTIDLKPACRGKRVGSPDRIRERSPVGDDDRRGGRSRGPPPPFRDTKIWNDSRDLRDDRYMREDMAYKSSGLSIPPYADTAMLHSLPQPPIQTVPNVERTNDCEIIVVNKVVTQYAEYIEHRLKKHGLTVDLLFPNEDVPIGRVLANISSRGSLYAIILAVQNEEHRSMTLNILHGQLQEHRNMPLDDAISLIVRNFEAFMRGERGGYSAQSMALERHPEAIQTLLNLLHLNRQLTVLQYDKVIKYLQERREMQVKLEVGDSEGIAPPAPDTPQSKQTELQNRIMSILNKTSKIPGGDLKVTPTHSASAQWTVIGSTGAALPAGQIKTSPSAGASAAAPPILNNPTVQKALDDLIQNDLLRKLAPANNSNAPASSQPLFGAYGATRKF